MSAHNRIRGPEGPWKGHLVFPFKVRGDIQQATWEGAFVPIWLSLGSDSWPPQINLHSKQRKYASYGKELQKVPQPFLSNPKSLINEKSGTALSQWNHSCGHSDTLICLNKGKARKSQGKTPSGLSQWTGFWAKLLWSSLQWLWSQAASVMGGVIFKFINWETDLEAGTGFSLSSTHLLNLLWGRANSL